MHPALRYLLLASLGLAPAVHAQSGRGAVRGLVLPRDAAHASGLGTWGDAADTVQVAALTITPVRTLACSDGRGDGCAPVTVWAKGLYGRYASGPLPMGRYRVQAVAPGCAVATMPLVIVSDSESVVHIAVACRTRR